MCAMVRDECLWGTGRGRLIPTTAQHVFQAIAADWCLLYALVTGVTFEAQTERRLQCEEEDGNH